MAEYGLFAGKTLWVDLSTGNIERASTNVTAASRFIGGWGMNASLAFDLIEPGMDAYDPKMPLIFGSCLLNGTPCPGTPKSVFTTKDKASNTVVTAVGSLLFGTMLKWAGYDHMIIKGKSERPVYLKIVDENVEIMDASDLWGEDIIKSTDILKSRHGDGASVACIGTAGEHRVPIAMMFNDYLGTFGRSFGGNLGAKNLKAIVVQGTSGTAIADKKRFMKTVNDLAERAMKDPLREKWTRQGLYFVYPMWVQAHYFSTDNFRESYPEKESYDIYGAQQFDRVKRRVIGCPSCYAPDKFLWECGSREVDKFEMMLSVPIDPAMSYGIRNNIGDFDKASWLFAESNRLGLDAMTMSALISFATDLYKRGIITKEDTGGLEIKSGFETAKELVKLTAERKGFGLVMGEGFEGMIGRFDHEQDAYQIKGTEPDFDARASMGVEVFGSVVNPRGAHDMPVGGMTVAKGRKPEFFEKLVSKVGYLPKNAWKRIFKEDGFNVARLTAYYENWAIILNCLGICFRMQNSSLYSVDSATELYSAGTGIETSKEELLKGAERAYNMYKLLNVREGFGRKDDRFPDRWFEPLNIPDKGIKLELQDYFGRKKLSREDTERMLDEYYQEKGWNVEKGIPTRDKLRELGLPTDYGAE